MSLYLAVVAGYVILRATFISDGLCSQSLLRNLELLMDSYLYDDVELSRQCVSSSSVFTTVCPFPCVTYFLRKRVQCSTGVTTVRPNGSFTGHFKR